MELNEKTNSEYKKDKAAYEKLQKAQTTLKKLERQMILVKRKKQDAQIKLIRAQEDKDADRIKEAKEEVAKAEKEEEKVKASVEALKGKLKQGREKVDSYIEELKKDPEFEAKVNEILEKRYNRQLNKEITELNELNTVIDLCDKHPTLANNLKGMIHAQEDLRKLQEQLEPLDYVNDKDKIDEIGVKIHEAVTKKETNLNMFINISAKKNVNVSKEFLEKLVEENGFAHDKEGNIKLDKSLKNIAKGYDKRIQTYQKAIGKIPNAKISPENAQVLGGNGGNQPPVTGSATQQQGVGATQQGTDQDQTTVLPPAEKLHWWQFKKRYEAWKQRKQEAKGKDNGQGQQQPDPAQQSASDPKKSSASDKFRDAYKYDIVRDYVDAQEENLFRETGREVRKGTKNTQAQQPAQQQTQQPTQDQDSGR